eukprot:14576457-Alexandrium_andersonii.AAC.1
MSAQVSHVCGHSHFGLNTGEDDRPEPPPQLARRGESEAFSRGEATTEVEHEIDSRLDGAGMLFCHSPFLLIRAIVD